MRIQNPHWLTQLVSHNPHGLHKIRIVGDEHSHVKLSKECVSQQVRRNIDVGALLLRLDDLAVSWTAGNRNGDGHRHFAGQEVTEDDLHVRKGGQSPQEGILASGLAGVATPGADPRSEVFDPDNVILGQ